ncbi:24548_t:CDS:2 [Cetraspora pellucida]|uniref:24548_t:CDS:1 n=1 Tax=Cetraspora pellucida TaxID=1433469 RepID=A0A9N9ATC1_9GLOM|nr:24548_t:CDS:2 [Cetraspora pellucida]
MNETGFVLSPKLKKVIAEKSTHQVHKISHRNETDHISVAPIIFAAKEELVSFKKEIKLLKEENVLFKKNNLLMQEELETFKKPGTCPLKLVLKYPVRLVHPSQVSNELNTANLSTQPLKKKKTLSFDQLLTNEESLQELKKTDELVKKKAKTAKHKKEEVFHKKKEALHKKKETL